MRLRTERIYTYFLHLTRRLSTRQIMMMLAVLVGVLAGVATYLSRCCSTPSRAG